MYIESIIVPYTNNFNDQRRNPKNSIKDMLEYVGSMASKKVFSKTSLIIPILRTYIRHVFKWYFPLLFFVKVFFVFVFNECECVVCLLSL